MSTDLPIACTLQPAEQAERARAWHALVARTLLSWRATEDGAVVRVRGDAEAQLRELIAAESQCCAFLEFDLRRDGEELLLSVVGPDEARPLILALFEPAK